MFASFNKITDSSVLKEMREIIYRLLSQIFQMTLRTGNVPTDWSNGEELHFVENGCHDNPTLDVTSDSQSEMQEKKASMNGVGMEGGGNWQVLVNKSAKEEAENMEEDTHL
ncbi:PDXL2 protein, partial [Amia calva]|nr:PDXL2 protein [Amia calva]